MNGASANAVKTSQSICSKEVFHQNVLEPCVTRHATSTLKKEKQRKRNTLVQVITTRQEKIYEQQCEIEELRRRIRAMCADNKYLREQNYWQNKALEKLDGKHAELPQLIDSHLEEMKVFREQIKRMKEVLKSEKHRRQEAEAANDKALVELRHLRKLAEEQNLLEKEDLMQTIERLKNETAERGKLLMNLERYAENLEKNQRCESIRHSKAQKEMRKTCEGLLDRIQALEQTVQEKQKIIELGNIYSKRAPKPSASTKRLDPSSQDDDSSSDQTDSNRVDDLLTTHIQVGKKSSRRSNASHEKTCKNLLPSCDGDCNDEAGTAGEKLPTQAPSGCGDQPETSVDSSHSSTDSLKKSNRDMVKLPKIRRHQPPRRGTNKNNVDKVTKSNQDSKQVRFSSLLPAIPSIDDEAIFQQLKQKENEARLLVEKHLESEVKDSRSQTEYHIRAFSEGDLATSRWMLERPIDLKRNVQSPDEKSHSSNKYEIAVLTMDPSSHTKLEKPCRETSGTPDLPSHEQVVTKAFNGTQCYSSVSSAPTCLNSPRVFLACSEISISGSSETVPIQETVDQICRPFEDHDIDEFFIAGTSDDSASDTMATLNEEDIMWQATPTNNAGSSARSSLVVGQTYPEPNGFQTNSNTGPDLMGVEYITETTLGLGPTRNVKNCSTPSKTILPTLSCAVRTKTLYTMNNHGLDNSMKNSK